MNPLAVLGRAASLFAGMVAAEWQAAAATFPSWPDGEEPVAAEEPRFFPGFDVYATVPQSSAAVPEAGAEQVPTPGTDSRLPGVGHPTRSLAVSAAIGLREYANTESCEAPTFWHCIADQLDPKDTK